MIHEKKACRRGIRRGQLCKYSQPHQVKHAPDVQIQDLLTAPVWRRLEGSSPRGAGVRYQDVEPPTSKFSGLCDELLDLRYDSVAAGHPDRAAFDVREGIEFLDRLVNAFWAFGFAGIDDDERAAGKEECGGGVEADAARAWRRFSGYMTCHTVW